MKNKPRAPVPSRLRRFLLRGGFVLLFLLAANWLLLRPMLVRAIVRDALADASGARVELDAADWRLGRTIRLTGLRVLHPATGEPILEVREAEAEFAGIPLAATRQLQAVSARGVMVHLTRRPDPREDLRALRPGPPPARIEQVRISLEDAVVRVRPDPASDETFSIPVPSYIALLHPGEPDGIYVEEMKARACGGTLEGRGSVRPDGSAATLHTTFAGIDLGIPAEANPTWRGRVGGIAAGSIDANYEAGEIHGVAHLSAERARFWALPVFRDLARVLEVKITPESRFETCAAEVTLHGDRALCEELKAEGGEPMDVRGKGVIKFDGSAMYVELAPRFLHTEKVPLIGKPTQAVVDLLGGTAVTVCMSGSIRAPIIEEKHGKPITDAIHGFLDLFK